MLDGIQANTVAMPRNLIFSVTLLAMIGAPTARNLCRATRNLAGPRSEDGACDPDGWGR